MATNSYSSTSSWTQTNALQPDRTTPPTLPVYSDTTPTQVLEMELSLPSATPVTLALPPGWTNITQARIVNIDPLNYLNLQLGASAGATSPTVILAPSGGEFMVTQAYDTSGGDPASVPVIEGQERLPTYGTWEAQGVTVSGAAASTVTAVYVWLAGL